MHKITTPKKLKFGYASIAYFIIFGIIGFYWAPFFVTAIIIPLCIGPEYHGVCPECGKELIIHSIDKEIECKDCNNMVKIVNGKFVVEFYNKPGE